MSKPVEFRAGNKKCFLKKIGKNDLEWIYGLMSSKDVRKRSFSQKKFSKEEHFKYWEKKLAQKGFSAIGIWVGKKTAGLIRIDKNKEISIAITPGQWGKGIAFNALKQLDLKHCKARVKKDNLASLGLFKKLGFAEKTMPGHILLEID